MPTSKSDPYLTLLEKVTKNEINKKVIIRGANGTSDVSHFAKIGLPGIEFGPIGAGIGSDDEWVDIPSLQNYYNILCKFISEYIVHLFR